MEAASISITSSEVPAAIVRQGSHSPQGVSVGPFTQFSERARIFAIEVFPGAARADEEVGVVDAVLLDRVRKGPDDVLLPDHLGEALRPVAAVEGG